MSRPPTSKLHRRCFSSWMPQESRNNLVQQKKNRKKQKKNKRGTKGKRARVSLCVCRGGRSVSGVPSFNNAAATQSVLLWWEYCSLGPSSMHRRRQGLFFFFKPIHPPHQHINMQSMPAYASAARTSVAGCQTESEESAEMWEWHSKCENPLIRQSGDMWCDLCTIYVCRMKECEYTNVFAWKFLGKPRGKKKTPITHEECH